MSPPRPSRKQWWRLVWIPVVVTLFLTSVLTLSGIAVAWWQIWGVGVVVVASAIALTMVPVPRGESEKTPRASGSTGFIVDRPFAEVNRWEDRLSWSGEDLDRSRHTVQVRLVALIGDRLRLRHGVDLERQPERAAEILPESLRRLVNRPLDTPLDPRAADELVRQIEEI